MSCDFTSFVAKCWHQIPTQQCNSSWSIYRWMWLITLKKASVPIRKWLIWTDHCQNGIQKTTWSLNPLGLGVFCVASIQTTSPQPLFMLLTPPCHLYTNKVKCHPFSYNKLVSCIYLHVLTKHSKSSKHPHHHSLHPHSWKCHVIPS